MLISELTQSISSEQDEVLKVQQVKVCGHEREPQQRNFYYKSTLKHHACFGLVFYPTWLHLKKKKKYQNSNSKNFTFFSFVSSSLFVAQF